MKPVYTLKQHVLRILVRNVPNHDSSSGIFAPQDAIQVNHELRVGVLASLLLTCVACLGHWASWRSWNKRSATPSRKDHGR